MAATKLTAPQEALVAKLAKAKSKGVVLESQAERRVASALMTKDLAVMIDEKLFAKEFAVKAMATHKGKRGVAPVKTGQTEFHVYKVEDDIRVVRSDRNYIFDWQIEGKYLESITAAGREAAKKAAVKKHGS